MSLASISTAGSGSEADDTCAIRLCQQPRQGGAIGQDQVRKVVQRQQHEIALGKARVRDRQLRVGQAELVVEQDVQVEGARPPVLVAKPQRAVSRAWSSRSSEWGSSPVRSRAAVLM